MSPQISPTNEKEYAELLAYLDFYSTYVSGVDPLDPIHPVNVMKQIVDKFGPAQALEGLRQAVNDTVEDLSGQSPEYVEKLDSALEARGIITFSEVRRRYASAYQRVLEHGSIENETEYYLITGILSDHSSIANESEKALLTEIVTRYEESF